MKLKVKVNGKELEGTATEVIMSLAQQSWDADSIKTPEEYLESLRGTYKRMCDEPMPNPEGTTEEKAQAALEALDKIKLIEIVRE